ncbi:MAG: hypothetical protein M3R68_11070 [Acidobacteriota bacterium]|nr:hypothetical protein [Acidobacteriota bacterium]
MDQKRELLRHTLATLAYRGGKAVRGAPDSFAGFQASESTRTPLQILTHIGDLLDWALSMASGAETWHNAEPLPWAEEIERFHRSLARFDEFLASDAELACTGERLFQGAIADSFTHVGQLTILRRMAGASIRGENYSVAEIEAGRVGAAQADAKYEFN